jgi:hypothetical protein
MAKSVHNDVLDAALSEIEDNCNLMTLCSQEPTTRTEAVTTYALADIAMDTGDFAIADGDTSGRKLTVAEQAGVTVDTSGTGNHVALVDDTRLLYVTTCTPQSVTATNTMTFPEFDIEISDPA